MFPLLLPKSILPGPTFLSILSLIFLVLAVLQWKKRDIKLTRLSPISICLLLFYGWGAAGYFYTGSLDTSYTAIVQYWGAIFLFLGLILYVKEETELHHFIWICLFCASIHSLSVVFQIIPAHWSLELETTDTITHFRNRNIFSSYILFFPPMALFLRSYSPSKLPRFTADFLFVLIMVAFWLAGSKGGEGAVTIEILLIGAYFLHKKDKEGIKTLVVLVFISTILYQSMVYVSNNSSLDFRPYTDKPQTISASIGTGGSLDQRIYYWQGAWKIIKDHWLTGTGPSTFSLVAPLYLAMIEDPRNGIHASSMDPGASMDPSHAHNLYLQFASELGIIGFSLFMLLIYFIYSKSYYLYRNAARPLHELNFFVVVSITGYLLHGLFEHNWGYSEYVYTFTSLIFIVDFTIRKNSPDLREYYGRFLSGFPMVLCGLILIGGAVISKYFFYLNVITLNNISTDQNGVMFKKNINRSKELCFNCGDPLLMMGESLLEQYYLTHQPTYLKNAHQEFEMALQKNPLDLRVTPYLIQTYALQGNFKKAKEICYKLFKYQKYESLGRSEYSTILIVESSLAKNPSFGSEQIVVAWEKASKSVRSRSNRVKNNMLKAQKREHQFLERKAETILRD